MEVVNLLQNQPSLFGTFTDSPHACESNTLPDYCFIEPNYTDPFHFDRLGVRVPAILVSPWVQKGTVINDVFEHASIPATVTDFFLGKYEARSPREKVANTFLDHITLCNMRPDCIDFGVQKP